MPHTDPTHGLSVPHADALWDAVAPPGPDRPTSPVQHERVCAAVAEIISEVTAGQAPTDQAGLRDRIRRAICEAEGFAWDSGTLEPDEYGEAADAVLAVLPTPADQAADEAAIRAQALEDAADFLRDSHFWDGMSVQEIGTALWNGAYELRRLAGEAPQDKPTESTLYQVVGDWGTESANDAEEARAAVASWLHDYPHSGAHAEQRIYREWPDGSEFYGPWTDLPEQPAVGAPQPKEA